MRTRTILPLKQGTFRKIIVYFAFSLVFRENLYLEKKIWKMCTGVGAGI
jgi:hypothetical protein